MTQIKRTVGVLSLTLGAVIPARLQAQQQSMPDMPGMADAEPSKRTAAEHPGASSTRSFEPESKAEPAQPQTGSRSETMPGGHEGYGTGCG